MVCPGRSSLLSSEQKRWHEETKWSLFLETMLIPGWTRKWFIDMARGRKEMCARGSRSFKLIVFAASLRAFWSELVQSLSRVRLFATPWTVAHQASLPNSFCRFIKSILKWTCHCSVTKSCPTLDDLLDCSAPDAPVLHCLPVCSHSCPMSRWRYPTISSSAIPFSFAPHLSPHLFQGVSSSHEVAKVPELQFRLFKLLSTWIGHEGSLLPLLWFLLSHRLLYLSRFCTLATNVNTEKWHLSIIMKRVLTSQAPRKSPRHL